jgi:hypothetical protein
MTARGHRSLLHGVMSRLLRRLYPRLGPSIQVVLRLLIISRWSWLCHGYIAAVGREQDAFGLLLLQPYCQCSTFSGLYCSLAGYSSWLLQNTCITGFQVVYKNIVI